MCSSILLMQYWIDLPSYHVLVNKGDEDFEYSYIAQENIIVVENMQVSHSSNVYTISSTTLN